MSPASTTMPPRSPACSPARYRSIEPGLDQVVASNVAVGRLKFTTGEAMEGARALVIITEWNEFRALDLARVKSLLRTPTIVDLRNIYKPDDMADAGFFYFSIGRDTARPRRAAPRAAGRG